MNELDEFWSEQLSTAIENAKVAGRQDVVDYLALKSARDAVRKAESERFFDAMIAMALKDDLRQHKIRVEREAPHNFQHRGANLVGSLLRLRCGVRCMTVEAGWTRTPNDGFMRLGALAFARITHFGIPKANVELMLRASNEKGLWLMVRDDQINGEFENKMIGAQFDVLLG
ncbi:MAG: hypothetical protein ACRD6X_02715 [Pyrinomonadaceae bacterium]